jgi:arylsulfatase A-like enzyme
VPLYALDPRHPQSGREVSALAMNVDLAPTFAALAGVAAPSPVNGVSLAATIQGGQPPARERALLECWGGVANGPGVHSAVRTARWKYVAYYADDARTKPLVRKDGKLELELYDLDRDPNELENLAHLGAAALAARGYAAGEVEGVKVDLAARLKQLEVE